jgi:hypothetical protein
MLDIGCIVFTLVVGSLNVWIVEKIITWWKSKDRLKGIHPYVEIYKPSRQRFKKVS